MGQADRIIFAVTGVTYDWPKSGTRCYGWYPHFELAEEAVYNNRGSLNEEGYYEWVVIEKIPEGVWRTAVDSAETWHHWEDEDSKYVRIDKPGQFKSVSGWGMG